MKSINEEKKLLQIILGITDFSLIDSKLDIKAFDYYKEYANSLINKLNIESIVYDSKNPLYKFDFDYLNYFYIDGYVDHKNQTDIVRINEGVIFKIVKMFYSILSHFPILPHLKESFSESFGMRLFYVFDKQKFEMEYRLPVDRKRKIIAEYLSMFAIKYIILHEIGHLYNGHIFLVLKNVSLSSQISMLNNKNFSIKALDLQTMEMDADAFAISRLIDESLVMIEKDKLLLSVLDNKLEIYFLLIYAIHCLFLLIKEEQNGNNLSHLPRLVRDMINLDCAKTNIIFKANNIITGKKFMEMAYSSYFEAEQNYNIVFNKITNMDEINECTNPQVLNNVKMVEANWVVLKEKLKPYARIRLAD